MMHGDDVNRSRAHFLDFRAFHFRWLKVINQKFWQHQQGGGREA